MKNLFLALIIIFNFQDAISQGKNTVNLEFLGKSVIYSVNFERQIFEKRNNYLSATVGFGILPLKNV